MLSFNWLAPPPYTLVSYFHVTMHFSYSGYVHLVLSLINRRYESWQTNVVKQIAIQNMDIQPIYLLNYRFLLVTCKLISYAGDLFGWWSYQR